MEEADRLYGYLSADIVARGVVAEEVVVFHVCARRTAGSAGIAPRYRSALCSGGVIVSASPHQICRAP